jgi:hypothetical protein
LHLGIYVHLALVQLAALNTLQFDWCKARLKGRPKPMAPVFQPDVARLSYGGASLSPLALCRTVFGVRHLVNQCIMGLLDRYLAHTTNRDNQGTRTGQSGSFEQLIANSEE